MKRSILLFKVAELPEEAEEDLLAFYRFPAPHWPKLRSTNPWSGLTARSGADPMSSGSSPTTPLHRRYLSAESSIALALEGQGDEGPKEVATLQAA